VESEVLFRGQRLIEGEVRAHPADPLPSTLAVVGVSIYLEFDGARAGPEEPGQAAHQGTLARSVGAAYEEKLSPRDPSRNPPKDRESAVAMDEIAKDQEGG
jgi:hypothetical protein